MQPATVKNDSALYSDTSDGRVLIFQRGIYVILITAPTGSPLETATSLGDNVQV